MVNYFTIRNGLEIATGLTSADFTPLIVPGSFDPTSVGQTAPIGSLFLRDTGDAYVKTGAPDTGWTLAPKITDINALSSAIDINSGDITSLSGAIDINSGDITSLSSAIDINLGDITTLSGAIDINSSDITNLSGVIDINSTDISYISGVVDVNAININSLSAAIDTNTGDITTIENQLTTGFVTTDTNQTVSGEKTFVDNMTVLADLVVSGTLTSIDSENLVVSDNIITLNDGETGAGVTLGTAGIEIDRGTADNVQLRWNETTDKWQITFDGTNYYDILTTNDGIATDLATLSAAIDLNSTNIDGLSAVIDVNTTNISSLSSVIDVNITNINSLSSAIDQNSTDITGISAIVGPLSAGSYIGGVGVAEDLVTLDSNLLTVSGDLNVLEATVGTLSAGSVVLGNSVAEDLILLDNLVAATTPLTAEALGVTSPTVLDYAPLTQFDVMGWEVFVSLDSDTTRRRAVRLNAMHNNTTADADTYSLLSLGTAWPGLDFDAQVSGSNLVLVVDSTQAASFKSTRVLNL